MLFRSAALVLAGVAAFTGGRLGFVATGAAAGAGEGGGRETEDEEGEEEFLHGRNGGCWVGSRDTGPVVELYTALFVIPRKILVDFARGICVFLHPVRAISSVG